MTYKRKSKLNALLVVLLLVSGCSVNRNSKMVFPDKEWQIASPESQEIDSKLMNKALEYLEKNIHYDGIKQMMIIRNGYMIYGGDDIDSVHNVWSCTKSFTGTVLGLLIDEGKCSLNTYATDFEPLLKDKYPTVTLRHFTTLTSGYNAVGDSRWNDGSADWSWTPYEPDTPLFDPGTQFAYWDEATMIFGRTLTQILGTSMREYLNEKVTNYIGMGEWYWNTEGTIDSVSINNGCTDIHLNAKQLARFGHLFLNYGNWAGKQLVSRNWVENATTVQVPDTIPVADTDKKMITGSGSYGYNWWINAGAMQFPGAPNDLYYAAGYNHNMCFVIPSWNMVVVRLGEDGLVQNFPKIWGEFFRLLGEAKI